MCYIKLSYSLNIYHNLVKKYLTITRSKHLNKIENILPRKMCIVKPSKHHISSDKRINYSTFSYISRRILLFTMGASLQWNFFEKGVIYSCMILKYKSFFTAVFCFFFLLKSRKWVSHRCGEGGIEGKLSFKRISYLLLVKTAILPEEMFYR